MAEYDTTMAAAQAQSLLRAARIASGLSQKEIAKRMGVHPSAVCRLLTTKKPRNIRLRTLVAFLTACGMRLRLGLLPPPLPDPYSLAA